MQPDLLDDYARSVIRRYAARLVGRDRVTRSDQHDLEQDLALDLLEHGSQFDPARAHRHTFVYRVIHNKATSIVRARRRLKRGHGVSFCRLDESEDLTALAHDRVHRRSDQERRQMELDVVAVVSRLSVDVRDLCSRLKVDSPAETARQLDIPRSTLRGRLRKLRAEFKRAGMRAYLTSA